MKNMGIKKKIKSLSSKNYFFRKIYNNLKKFKRKITLKHSSKKIKIDDKLVIFCTFSGRQYSDSPKAIYEYMLADSRFDDFKFIWALKNPKKQKVKSDPRTTVVKYDTKKFFDKLAEAKYWVFNFKTEPYFYKKEGQVYLQCWHGTPLKRLGCDIDAKNGNVLTSVREIHKQYHSDSKKYDYFISPSAFCTEKFSSAFDLKKLKKEDIIVECGYPRNDFLYNYTDDDVIEIKERLNIPPNKKIILYAPTYRDNQHTLGKGYTYKTEVNFDLLQEKLKDEYIILFRAHYFVANSFDFTKYEGFVYNVSKVEDINELYIISDMLITDYSSVFFDYANLKRPIVFYMYDLEDYQEDIRGFYIDLDELPGNIIKTDIELIEEIKRIDKEFEYNQKYRKFNDKYNYLDDGSAAARITEKIMGIGQNTERKDEKDEEIKYNSTSV